MQNKIPTVLIYRSSFIKWVSNFVFWFDKPIALVVYTSLAALRTFQQLIEARSKPEVICVDNGPEFISDRLQHWCDDRKIRLQFIQPGPMQNGFVEKQRFPEKRIIGCLLILQFDGSEGNGHRMAAGLQLSTTP